MHAASPEVSASASRAASTGPGTGATVTVASRPSSSAHSSPSGWSCGGSEARRRARPSTPSTAGSRSSQRSAATSSRLSRLHTPSRSRLSATSRSAQLPVRGPVQVEHAAALRVRQRADAVPGRLRGQLAGAGAAAAQDHQRHQVRLGDQRARGLPAGRADQLHRGRVQPGGGQRRPDHLVQQRGGGDERGRAGAQHARRCGTSAAGTRRRRPRWAGPRSWPR